MDGKGAYASDEIVNTFFKLLSQRTIDLSTENPSRTWPRCQYMSSLFMEKVMDLSKSEQPGRGKWPTYFTGKNGITRWRPEVSPLEFDFIFFPINVDSNHWILAVVAVSSEEVRIYDPLPGGEYMDYGRTILRYLTEQDADVMFKKWKIVVCQSPSQTNLFDCGQFICLFAYFLSLGLPLPEATITTANGFSWRDTMACYLVDCRITVPTELSSMVASLVPPSSR